MPRADETRILQMQFDNKEFERDIQTSEKSLDRFKEALDFSKCEKGLEAIGNAAKSLSFSNLVDNIQKLTDKFTGLGTVSELVLSQIRRGIESAASKISSMVDSLAFDTIGEGKNKFEELNKNVQTIIGATGRSEEDVYKVMERLNKYTDMTSYNFTDMANNIGKFTSVGIKLEDAEKQMEGIANWAARSGAGISEASRAMYNLSQAMGMGKMTTMDWKSIENAGMATMEFKKQMIQAGLATGTLEMDSSGVVKTAKSLGKQMEVTYQNLRETLSKGWADRLTMEKTLMGYYYDDLEYAEEKILNLSQDQLSANKEIFDKEKIEAQDWINVKGLQGITDDVKEQILDLAVDQKNLVEDTDKNGKKIYKTVNKNGKEITFTLEEFDKSLSYGWLDKNIAGRVGLIEGLAESAYKAAQKCTTLTDVFNAWKDQLSTGWMRAWQNIFGPLSESMELFSTICDKVGESFSDFIRVLTGDGAEAKGILGHWAELGGRDSLWGLFVGEYDGMYEGAYGFLDVLKQIGEMINQGFWDLLYTMNAGTLQAKGISAEDWFADEEYRTYFMANRFKDGINNIQDFVKGIHDWFNAVPEGQAESRIQKIQKFVNGIFSLGTIMWNTISDIFGFFTSLFDSDHLGPSVDALIDILEALGFTIRNTASETSKGNGLKLFFDQLLEKIKPVTDGINKIITKISEFIVGILKSGSEGGRFSKIWNGIVEIFGKLFDIVSKIAGPVLDFIGSILDAVGILFKDGVSKASVQKAGNAIAEAVGKLFGDIFGLFPGFSARIEKFFSYIFGFAEDDASDQADGSGSTILGVIKKWLKKIFGGTADFVGDFKNELGNVSLFSIIKENLGIGLLSKFLGGIGGIVKGTNLYGLIMTFLGGYSLIKLIKMLKKAGGMFEKGGGLFGSIANFFNDLKGKSLKEIIGEKFFGDKKDETSFGDKLWQIAKSIGIIVGAIVILGKMPIQQLTQGVIAFGIIAAVIAALMFVLNKMVSDVKQAKQTTKMLFSLGFAILGISIGMAILIKALRPLADMRIEQIINMLTGLGGVMLILGIFAKYVGSAKIKGTGSMAMLAIAVGILVLALKPLASMDTTGLLKMGASLVVILGVLAIFSKKAYSMKKSGMGSMVMVAVSIWILLEALKPLANYKWEDLGKMAAGLVVLLVVIALFTEEVSSMKGSKMGSLVMVAISIFILLEALKPLANYDWEQLGKMAAGLVVLMFVLRQFTANSESMKGTGMLQMVLVAAAVWVLLEALKPLANYSWENLGKMAAGLVILATVIVLMSRLTGDMGLIKGGGLAIMMLGLAAVLASFALVMGSISGVSWESIAAATVGFIAILIVFALITKQMMLMKTTDIIKVLPIFVMLLGLAAVMIAFSFAMNEIKSVDAGKILAFAGALSAILIVFSAAILVVGSLPIAVVIKGILSISVGLIALFGVIALMAPVVMGSVGSAIAQMSAQLSLVGSLMETFSGRMSGVDEGSIDKGENMLNRLKDMVLNLAGFIGFKTDISGFTTVLFDLGTGLQNFAWHMSQTGDISGNAAVKLIQDLAGCANDLDTITKLNIDEFTTKITGLGGAMMLYAEGARQVASEGGVDLDENNMPDVTAAVALMKSISESLASSDGVIIPENMPDEQALGLFGAQLAALAGAMIQFEQAGVGLGEGTDKALEVLTFFQQLKNKLDETQFVTAYNEVTGTFSKEKVDADSLTELGKNIEQLGAALGNFAANTTNVNQETGDIEPMNFDSALETLATFVSLKEKMPDVGGVLQFFVGSKQSLIDLGSEIEGFGTALKSLSSKVTGTDENGNKNFDPESTKLVSVAADDILEMLKVVNEKLPSIGILGTTIGAIKSFFTGRPKSIGELGEEVAEFGVALNKLSNSISGKDEKGNVKFDPSVMETTKQALTDMMDILEIYNEKLPSIGSLGVAISGFRSLFIDRPKTINELGDEMAGFGESLNHLSENLIGKDKDGNLKYDPAVMPLVKSAVNGMIDIMTLLNDENNGLPKIKGLGGTLAELFTGKDMDLKTLGDQVGAMSEGLGVLGKNLSEGKWSEDNGITNMLSALDYIMDIMVQVSEMNTLMQSTGSYVSTFANFVSMLGTSFNDLSDAETSNLNGEDSVASLLVKAMADINNAFDKYGNIDPNRISIFNNMANALWHLSNVNPDSDWESIGRNIAGGVSVGIAKGTSGVIDAAVAMAVSAYKAAKEALDEHSPSRIFATLGDFAAKGLALGIDKGTSGVSDAGENMANSAVLSAKGPLELLSSLLSQDVDMNPVITPILDLSNITSGSQTLNGLFNNPYGISLAGGSLSLDPTQATIYADTSLPRDYSQPIEDIRSEVSDLRSDIKNLSDSMRQMKFVFNSGAVVAAIGPEMDEYLGRQGYYAVRGEIP